MLVLLNHHMINVHLLQLLAHVLAHVLALWLDQELVLWLDVVEMEQMLQYLLLDQ